MHTAAVYYNMHNPSIYLFYPNVSILRMSSTLHGCQVAGVGLFRSSPGIGPGRGPGVLLSRVSSSSENGQHLRVLFFFDKPVTFFFVAVSCVCGLCVWIHLTLVLRVMKFVDTLFFAKEIESVMMTSSRSSSRCVRCAGPREMDPWTAAFTFPICGFQSTRRKTTRLPQDGA